MKKFMYLLLAGATFYLAGMFRYLPLMVLFVMEIFLFLVCFFMSRYFKKNLSIEAVRRGGAAGKDMPFVCSVKVFNKGKLPISRFGVRYQCGYRQYPEINGKWVYGGSRPGESILDFEVYFPYCGMAYLWMDKVKLYDYLSLFDADQAKWEKMEVAVFPGEKAMRIETPESGYGESMLPQTQAARQGQDAHSVVRLIREYRPGDSNRYIHWKQSARMDELLVKEYEKEKDYQTELFLDMEGFSRADLSGQDAFYELLSALVLGLLRNVSTVQVYWYDGKPEHLAQAEIAHPGDCRNLLEQLYRLEFPRKEQQNPFAHRDNIFRLDAELCWHWNNLLIYQFSQENLEEEITQKIFVL